AGQGGGSAGSVLALSCHCKPSPGARRVGASAAVSHTPPEAAHRANIHCHWVPYVTHFTPSPRPSWRYRRTPPSAVRLPRPETGRRFHASGGSLVGNLLQ